MERIVKPIHLTNRAIKDIVKIKKFNSDLYGEKIAGEIVEGLFAYLEVLENRDYIFSKIGAQDEAFSHLKTKYRKLIINTIKITYRVWRAKMYVVHVFDTRQNPKKNK